MAKKYNYKYKNKIRICVLCGKEFYPTSPCQKYCGNYKIQYSCGYVVHNQQKKNYPNMKHYSEYPNYYYKKRCLDNFGTVKNWEKLKNKLREQNNKCAYSGKDIVLGINDSIDHIKPIFRYPEMSKELDNVVWADRIVNKMKGTMSVDEFLTIIKMIYKFNFIE